MHRRLWISFTYLLALAALGAQSTANDIPIQNLPQPVRQTLETYISVLRTSAALDVAAQKFAQVAGGSLVNEDGSVSSNTSQFSLKKDWNNIKHYADPIIITRVNATPSNGQGYGPMAIKGMVYKVWIRKKDPALGMPAPVSIMVPEGHPSIKTPRIVGIGSF